MYKRLRVDSVYYVRKTLSYLRPKTCDLMPKEGKQLHSHKSFKLKIKKGIPQKCLFRPCKISKYQVGVLIKRVFGS